MPTTEAFAPLPEIPRKRYFAIGEVSDLCLVKAHVLRYWEQEFPQLKPVKRRGNRRYYQQEDVMMVRNIRNLLYEQGFTIGGARQRLRDRQTGVSPSQPIPANPAAAQALPATVATRGKAISQVRHELELLLKLFD